MPSLTIRNRILPGGEELPGVITVQDPGPGYQLYAWPTITIESSPGVYKLYHFYFWNINGDSITTGLKYEIGTINSDVTTSAWYWAMADFKPPPDTVQTYLFYMNTDAVIDKSPIKKTKPYSAWAGGESTVVSTSIPADEVNDTIWIHAKKYHNPVENSNFWSCWHSGLGSNIDGNQLHVGLHESDISVAFYRNDGINPNPTFKINPDLNRIYAQVSKIKTLIEQVDIPSREEWKQLTDVLRQAQQLKSRGEDELSGLLAEIELKDEARLKIRHSRIESGIARLEAASALLKKAIRVLEMKKND